MMHILFNGYFWTQPTVGSGQYLHGLLRWLPRIAPEHQYTLLLPAYRGGGVVPPAGIRVLMLKTPFDGRNDNLAKLWFEQISVPETTRLLHHRSSPDRRLVLHVPYFAPPVRTPIVPLVATVPDIIPLLLPAYRGGPHVRAYMRLVRAGLHRASRVITFSAYSRDDIAQHLAVPASYIGITLLAAEERYRALHTGIQRTRAAAQVTEKYGLRRPFIYYVGGIDARKNVEVLVQAVALLAERGQFEATLALAGRALGSDRRLFPDLDATIAEAGVANRVRRIDVPYEDGPLLYQTCTAFAFPSTYEGFGLPPLEAMACGAPVVVSNTSSLPEVVDGAALQVAPDDVAGWATALQRLLGDADLRAGLREQGLARAAQFSWQRVAQETLAVYEQIDTEINSH